MKRTYKNTEEKRREMVFQMIKSYKNRDTLDLQEILLSGSEVDQLEFDNEGVNYREMAERLLELYKDKSFDLGLFVFEKQIFEDLWKKMKMGY